MTACHRGNWDKRLAKSKQQPVFARAWDSRNGRRASSNELGDLIAFDLLAGMPSELAFGIEILVACIPGRHVNTC